MQKSIIHSRKAFSKMNPNYSIASKYVGLVYCHLFWMFYATGITNVDLSVGIIYAYQYKINNGVPTF